MEAILMAMMMIIPGGLLWGQYLWWYSVIMVVQITVMWTVVVLVLTGDMVPTIKQMTITITNQTNNNWNILTGNMVAGSSISASALLKTLFSPPSSFQWWLLQDYHINDDDHRDDDDQPPDRTGCVAVDASPARSARTLKQHFYHHRNCAAFFKPHIDPTKHVCGVIIMLGMESDHHIRCLSQSGAQIKYWCLNQLQPRQINSMTALCDH